MELFDIVNNKLVYSPQSLTISHFKEMWDRDKSKGKEKAIAELSAIYYMVDYKSDFQSILDDRQRLKEITSVLTDLGKEWKPDAQWMDAVEFYKKLQETPSIKLVNSAKSAIARLETFFNTVDLTHTDKSGKPKYNPKQLADTIGTVPKLVASINQLEEQIKKEMEQKNNKLRGGKQKGAYAD